MDVSDSDFESAVDLLRTSKVGAISFIDPLSNISGKYRDLLKRGNASVVTISPDEREFKFSDLSFIDRVEVVGPDVIKILKGLSLVVITHDGARVEIVGKESARQEAGGSQGSVVVFTIGRVVAAVALRSKMKWRELRLVRFAVVGYAISGFERAAEQVRDVEVLLSRVDSYVQGKAAAVSEARAAEEELRTSMSELEEEQSNALAQQAALNAEITGLLDNASKSKALAEKSDRDLKDVNSRIEISKNNESQLRSQIEELNKNVSEKSSELRRLSNDRNLISDEYSDYVGEGKKQSRVYEWFLYFSIAVIAVAAVHLYSGADRILNADVATVDQVAALALQRAPFAATLALIVTVAWRLGSLFVQRIMRIHEQRLALARILVIAKETVYSAAAGRDISDESKFREHLKLKLAMLRAHLTTELGREFEYMPEQESEGEYEAAEVEEVGEETDAQDSAAR